MNRMKPTANAREESVVDPVETIRQLAEARKLSQKFADEVVSSYAAEPAASRFGVIYAFTRAGRRMLRPLQRIEAERFAGTLLGADPNPLQGKLTACLFSVRTAARRIFFSNTASLLSRSGP